MRKRTAALVLSGAMVAGAAGTAVVLTPASAATSGNPVSSRLAQLKSALGGLVKDGTLTQAQADKVASTLDQNLPKRGAGAGDRDGGLGGPMGGHGGGRMRGGLAAARAAAATALHLTTDQLRTQLQSGKTLAQIAKAQNVSVETLVTAMVDAARTDLAAQVKAGRLTQAQADTMTSSLTRRVTDLVDGVGPARGFGGPRGPGTAGAPNRFGTPNGTATPDITPTPPAA